MKIANHKIDGCQWRAANASGAAMTPTLLVLHDTAGRVTKGSSVEWFASKDCNTSAHVVVERDGSITQMVAFNKKAFHAGRSSWKGREFCNSFSIGIEIVNPGELDANGKAWFGEIFHESVRKDSKEHGSGHRWLPYTPEQIEAAKALCRALCEKYSISEITTHWAISPRRKVDTGPLFPLEDVKAFALADNGRKSAIKENSPSTSTEPVKAIELPATPAPVENTPVASISSVTEMVDRAETAGVTIEKLASMGSRLASVVHQARLWVYRALFGSTVVTGGVSVAQQAGVGNGTIEAAGGMASDHLVLIMGVVIAGLIAAIVAIVCLVHRYLLTAAKDGRYAPKPST